MKAGIPSKTGKKRARAARVCLATREPLTGLPNRLLFTDRLALSLSNAQRGERQLALLFIDLDRFKNINDSLGHPVGDAFLKAAAERLSDVMRKGDTLAMAQSLGINVIAEGVETENQLQVLRALGCNQYQGYLFCPPLPAAELERRFFTAPDAQPAR